MNNLRQTLAEDRRPGLKIRPEFSVPPLMSITRNPGLAHAGRFEPPFYGFEPVSGSVLREYLSAQFVPKLITVSAPAGYGKTVFLAQLYRAISLRGRPCIWVSLDPSDHRAEDILTLIGRAVALRESAGQSFEQTREGIIARLIGLDNPVLFLDNLHFCTDPALSDLLDALIFATGAALRLALSSTAEIPFNRGRARLELGGADIGPKELSFDAGAIRALLAQAGQALADEQTIKVILQKTDGWPMAVRLIQMAMSEEAEPGRALDEFSGRDADLVDMLRQRLLAGFTPALVDFLLDLSPLRVFSVELAKAVTGDETAGARIADLIGKNAFIRALDRNRLWFRFHPLFQDFLRGEDDRRAQAGRGSGILEKAARWCHLHGYVEDAAHYALAAPAPDLVREIMDANARNIVSDRGDLATYLEWIDRARELGIELGFEAEFWYAWALTLSRRYQKARQTTACLESRLAAMPQNAAGSAEMTTRMDLLRMMLVIVNDDMEAARVSSIQWLQAEPSRTPVYTLTAALVAATSLIPQQHYNEARRYIQIAQGAVSRIGGSYSHAWMATTKAILELELGNPAAAEQVLTTAIAEVGEQMGLDSRMVATLATLKARALCDLGRSEEAREILLSTLARAAAHGFVDTTRQGLEAAVALGGGEETGPLGFAALDSLAASAPPRLRRLLAAAQIRRLMVLGETSRALDIGQQAGISTESQTAAWLPSETLVIGLARIDLLAGDGRIKAAQKLAEQIMPQITALGRRREIVELYLAMAHLHTLANEPSLAVKAVSRALTLAAPRGLVQPFLQHQKTFKDVLLASRLKEFSLTLSEQISFFQTICARTGALIGQSQHAANRHEGEVGMLTRREIEILTLLESGPSNEQLADQLAVSLQTVKWHLYNLYAKLGVKNRAASLAKARSLKLLP